MLPCAFSSGSILFRDAAVLRPGLRPSRYGWPSPSCAGRAGAMCLWTSFWRPAWMERLCCSPIRPKRRLGLTIRGIKRSEEHTSELQSQFHLVCRLLLEKKKRHPFPQRAQQKGLMQAAVAGCGDAPLAILALTVLTIFDVFFFFNDTATTEIYTLSLHDALPI